MMGDGYRGTYQGHTAARTIKRRFGKGLIGGAWNTTCAWSGPA
jgi:hypothetical protein